jgi:chaperone modulatory protein CbpM
MTERFSEDDVIIAVTRLTRRQLSRFVECELVRPERSESGDIYRRVDIARLELLCELSQDLDLDETALGIVILLIDQLHAARQDLAIMARAIDTLPTDLQARIIAATKQA